MSDAISSDASSIDVIVSRHRPWPLKTFAAYTLHQVTLWQFGKIGLQEAADGLRLTAARHGLVASYGKAEIEWIIGWAFAEVGVDYGDIRPLEGVRP
jgi:hypothetical protein